MQVCTSLQTDNHASTLPLSFFTGQMPFLLPNQQHQSTEGTTHGHGLKKSQEENHTLKWVPPTHYQYYYKKNTT